MGWRGGKEGGGCGWEGKEHVKDACMLARGGARVHTEARVARKMEHAGKPSEVFAEVAVARVRNTGRAKVINSAEPRVLSFPVQTQDLYVEVKEKLVPAVQALKMGDPKDEDVFIGPLISEKEAQRVESWVEDARSRGNPRSLAPPGLAPPALQSLPLKGQLRLLKNTLDHESYTLNHELYTLNHESYTLDHESCTLNNE